MEKKKGPAFQKYIFAGIEDIDGFRIMLRKVQKLAKILGIDVGIVSIYPEKQEMLQRLGSEEHVIRYSEGYMLRKADCDRRVNEGDGRLR